MSYDFFNTKTVKVRKQHTCEQCRQKIEIGESCEYGAGLFNGDFFSYYEHSDCRSAWQEISKEDLHYENSAPFIRDRDDLPEWRPLLTEKYPAVAARLYSPTLGHHHNQ